MEKVKVYEVVKVTDEVESCYNQMEVTPPKKRKSKAHEDNVEKPKKPRSAYLLYYFDVHQMMQQEVPNLPQSEINKRISESWKRLSVAEKSYYLEKAKSEKEGIDTPGFCQPEVSMESLDPPPEGGLPSASLTQEPQFQPLGLAGEVELSEQLIVVDDIAEETAAASHPTTLQGIPPSSSSSISSKAPASTDAQVSQNSADLTANRVTLKGNETRVAGSGYGGAMVQQIQGETTQVVAIIPTQNLLETKSLAGVSSVGPVMMVSVGGSAERSATPSYKMSVKTYTRRGRGRCLNPGCSFVYVTRHKPPTCPECGSHLGGKWIPAAKKTQEKEAASKQLPEKAETKSKESCQATSPCAQEGCADVSKTNTTGSKKDGQVQRCGKKQRAVPAVKPPEGSSIKSQEQTEQLKDSMKSATVQSQSRSSTAVQKRPDSPVAAEGNQPVASLTDRRVNIVSVVPFKQHTVSNFDLGLSTARGRGRCKNPFCDYMYKNRHKPAVCPKCGCELTQRNAKGTKSGTLLDPYQALSAAQKDLQRQSTLQLLRRSLLIPESETELQETLTLIQELNSLQIVLVQPGDQEQEDGTEAETLVESGWPQFYESAATHCSLCNYPLFKGDQSTVAGQEDCWLLTETLIQTASLQLKVCLNVQCLALHSFTDLHPGLFNIGNKLLVSIDLFLKIRANLKLGHPPSQVAKTLLDHVPNHPVHALSPEESSQIQELLLSGYWAFECLTVRDYNDMICGICGVAPKLEISQRYTNNVLELKNVEVTDLVQKTVITTLIELFSSDSVSFHTGVTSLQFTWPEFSISDEVHVDDFWLTMESEAIEQAAFPTDIPITRVDASIIAPFIPPLMRSPTVINTEKDKVLSHTQQPSGDPSVLVRLIHDGQLRLDKIEDHSEDELRTILDRCRASITPGSTKNELLASLISLYTLVHGGLATAPQPPQHLTAGKLSKVCPHKVVCGSKYLVRGETARDHVDLLLSSRYWPPVYVNDCARQVALCADMQYPELAAQMWGRNQGCFSDPFEKPVFVSCAELEDQPYSADQSLVGENQQVHPITKSSSCWLVYPPGAAQAHDPPAPEHHSLALCRDLEPYISLINQVVKACQPGEVVIRDALYRLGVAQINTEREEDEGSGMEGQKQEEGAETTYEVVLPE
eukprot:superscaffoldBa00001659_g11508